MSAVQWLRISHDLAATTGRQLELLADVGPGAFVEVYVFLDGASLGGFGRSFAVDPEGQLAEVADLLREQFLDEEIWGGWPVCPDHHTHPLEAVIDPDGVASWQCPRGRFVARIGDLRAYETPPNVTPSDQPAT